MVEHIGGNLMGSQVDEVLVPAKLGAATRVIVIRVFNFGK